MTAPEATPREASLSTKVKKLIAAFIGAPESRPTTEPNSPLSLDETLNLLCRERRRQIIHQMAEIDQKHISVTDLTEAIACAEYDCTPSELESDERKRIRIALHQSHLPRLEEVDVLAYDRDTKVVTKGPHFDYLLRAYTAVRDALS